MVRICFVCLGNICRSPTAEGVTLAVLREEGLEGLVAVESAGTAAYHAGERPDPRSLAKAREHGVELPGRARRFTAEDFDRFDRILVMDHANRRDVLGLARSEADRARVELFRAFDPEADEDLEVPDPYYGGADGFQEVFDICRRAARGLVARLRDDLGRS